MNDPRRDPFHGFDSEPARLLRARDWSATPLGPLETWPSSLVGYVSMILALPTPAIVFWGPEQTQIYNEGYAVIMGPRHPRHFGSPYRECWPDTYPLIYPWMRRVLDQGESLSVEKERIAVTRYGFEEDAWFTFTFSPLRDDAGRIAGIFQPVFEVTDTVLAERRALALRALAQEASDAAPLERFFAALAEDQGDVPYALVYLAQDGAAAGAGGLARAPGPAPPLREDALALLDAAAAHVQANGQRQRLEEARLAGPGGQGPAALLLPICAGTTRGVAAFGLSGRLHFDRAYERFLESVADQLAAALQRASAAGAVQRHRRHLHELFLQAPAGIAVLQGPEHVFELANPGFFQLIGPRDVIGKPFREACPDLQDQPFGDILDRVYRSGEPYVGEEEPAVLARGGDGDAEERFFNFVYQPLREEGRAAIGGILVFAYEVTEQVRARQQAEGYAIELTAEHRRKDEFLAMLAHELRNPLAPIRSASAVLAMAPQDEARMKRMSEIIARQVGHMTSLVDDLLEVSRVTRGLITLDLHDQDLKSVVGHAVEQVQPLMESKHHRLLTELPPEPAHVRGDRERLVQVLTNLLENAAKYTPDGGEIRLAVTVEGAQVAVRVRDNGVGIPPELQPRVFDLFVQAERARDRSQGGLGIGLALVRGLVLQHGGSIECASPGPGGGSEFTVRLPRLVAPPGAREAAAQAGRQTPTVPLRVLVVDDNEDAAQMLGLYLENEGHTVLLEHDSRRALERALAESPDVCLLDIGLPHLDGYELARRLRAAPQTAHAMLVAVTGYSQRRDRSEAAQAGFDHFLVKPPDHRALAALLAQVPARRGG